MHKDLLYVCDQLELHRDGTFAIAGRSSDRQDWPLDPDLECTWDERSAPPAAGDPPAAPVERLAAFLYRECYIRPSAAQPPLADVPRERDFQAALAEPNTRCDAWEPGWRAEASEADGRLVVSRRGVRFWVNKDAVRPGAGGFRPGQHCSVRTPNEYRRLLRGFHLLVGNAEPREGEPVKVRLYWHLTACAAPDFLTHTSRLLNRASIPFQVKVPNTPRAYGRADAGVIYLAREDALRAGPLLRRIYAAVGPGLQNDVPRFTKRLGPGLGLAEDPGNGMSFGQHRCRLIARAVWAAYREGRCDARSRRDAVDDGFRAEGLASEVPFLSANSVDNYRLTVGTRRERPAPRDQSIRRANSNRNSPLLAAAVRIGEDICREAHWDSSEERCTWIGRTNPPTPTPEPRSSPTAAVLGYDLYGGVSGIALFLAELFACTGQSAFRRTALGAITQATCRLAEQKTAATVPVGLHTGISGVALAACRVGERTGTSPPERLVTAAVRTVVAPDNERSDDLIEGRAGAIMALLALGRVSAFEHCRELASTLGEELCRSRVEGWRATTSGEPLLTGLSHGAAGIGLALLELYADTGRKAFLNAGRDAFAYEDALYDPVAGNWPDLRFSTEGSPDRVGGGFAVAWCHGAPGIALARLRASQLDPGSKEVHLAQARAALETTRADLLQRRPSEAFDATPCHGLAGLIEALWVGGLLLGAPKFRIAAREAGHRIATALLNERVLRSGTLCGGRNPSLMLGSAGIGYHFLRLHDPSAVPAVLVVAPEGATR